MQHYEQDKSSTTPLHVAVLSVSDNAEFLPPKTRV